MTLTPAQKALQELQESYTNYLLEVNKIAKEVVASNAIRNTQQGTLVPSELWNKLVEVTKIAS